MHKVSIKPQWTISDAGGQNLTPRLLELLAEVQSHGSLSGSCKKMVFNRVNLLVVKSTL